MMRVTSLRLSRKKNKLPINESFHFLYFSTRSRRSISQTSRIISQVLRSISFLQYRHSKSESTLSHMPQYSSPSYRAKSVTRYTTSGGPMKYFSNVINTSVRSIKILLICRVRGHFFVDSSQTSCSKGSTSIIDLPSSIPS